MTEGSFAVMAKGLGPRTEPIPKYLAFVDFLALRAVGVTLTQRELATRWGVVQDTARRWSQEVDSLPVETVKRPGA